jgi:hypothetical protein
MPSPATCLSAASRIVSWLQFDQYPPLPLQTYHLKKALFSRNKDPNSTRLNLSLVPLLRRRHSHDSLHVMPVSCVEACALRRGGGGVLRVSVAVSLLPNPFTRLQLRMVDVRPGTRKQGSANPRAVARDAATDRTRPKQRNCQTSRL